MTTTNNMITDTVRDIWAQILEHTDFGNDEHFFECGGDSVRAAMVLARIQEQLEVEIELLEFFDNPTVEMVSKLVADQRSEPKADL